MLWGQVRQEKMLTFSLLLQKSSVLGDRVSNCMGTVNSDFSLLVDMVDRETLVIV